MTKKIAFGILKGVIILLIVLILVVFLAVLPYAAVKVYNSVFHVRIQTSPDKPTSKRKTCITASSCGRNPKELMCYRLVSLTPKWSVTRSGLIASLLPAAL